MFVRNDPKPIFSVYVRGRTLQSRNAGLRLPPQQTQTHRNTSTITSTSTGTTMRNDTGNDKSNHTNDNIARANPISIASANARASVKTKTESMSKPISSTNSALVAALPFITAPSPPIPHKREGQSGAHPPAAGITWPRAGGPARRPTGRTRAVYASV